MKRLRYSGTKSCKAYCRDCTFKANARNGMAQAAAHHDDTGHTVSVEQTIHVTYTRPGSAFDAEQRRGQ